jgi:hypothetical protein
MKTFLLAYPRSGSSLLRYILGYITQSKPLQSDGRIEPSLDNLLINEYKNAPFIYKHHQLSEGQCTIEPEQTNKLILLVRNPMENILSYVFSSNNISKDKNNDKDFLIGYFNSMIDSGKIQRNIDEYKKNILYYDNYKFDKIIINYENLISNPNSEITKLGEFMGSDKSRILDFLNNREKHYQKILNEKLKDHLGSNTLGKKLTMYSDLSSELKNKFYNLYGER